jgi:FeS assembly protein IscX
MSDPLNWEAAYAIALALKATHPDADLQNVSLNNIFEWTIALPEFEDDPSLANDDILSAIYQDWFEEKLHE